MEDASNPTINIAHYQQRERELQSKLDELIDFVENASLPLHWVDGNGIIIWANQAELDLLGYTKDEYIGFSITDFHTDENVISDILTRLTNNETLQNYASELRCKNGSIKHVLINSNVLTKNGEFVHTRCFTRDITELNEASIRRDIILQELEKSEAKLKMVIASVNLGTWEWEPKTGLLTWSDECKKIYGLPLDKEITFEIYVQHLHPDDKERVVQAILDCLDGAYGGEYDIVLRIIRFDDGSTRWVRAQGKVYFEAGGKAERFIGTVVDITEKKQEDLRKNDFIAMVSHELKTPLTAVKSYIQILLAKEKMEGNAFKLNALTRAEVQTQKMTLMIQDFLSLARLEEGKIRLNKEVFELHNLIEEIAGDAQFLASSHTVKLQDCEDIIIRADRDKIGQVLMNLLSNAIKYSPKGGSIVIGCVKLGNKVKVFVKDDGIGISLADQQKLFDKFYRVKNEKIKTVSGFGIGLYLVSELLRYHKTKIEVESREDEGSTFYFTMNMQQAQL